MKQQAAKRTTRSKARSDWKFAGAEVPPATYDAMVAEAADTGVAQAVIIRWALETYLSERLEAAK